MVGSTFDISLYLDTKGKKINVIEAELKFPPDILQVVQPAAGMSFVSQWLTPPNYSNTGGTISFKGGIPEGIETSSGLVSTVTFRAKSSGLARMQVLSSSKVFRADGQGSQLDVLGIGGEYRIIIPPPEGPRIFSDTHSDQDKWYQDSSPHFSWEKDDDVSDFSYAFSQNPQEIPDTFSEGTDYFRAYDEVPDGIWYFHLRQKKSGSWGKASHFAVKIDHSPPEQFELEINVLSGLAYFGASDDYSGISHYEVAIISDSQGQGAAPFFMEAVSPFKIQKEPGYYDFLVRAYDNAGNFQTAEKQFQIFSRIFSVEEKGIQFKGLLIPFGLLYLLSAAAGLVSLAFIIYLIRGRGFRKGIKEIKEAISEIDKIEKQEGARQTIKDQFNEEKAKLEARLK